MSVVTPVAACPICSGSLTPHSTDHGLVWVCESCRAFGANLVVVRKVAPRQFVKHLWLAAMQQGVPSKHPCPSCGQPLQRFDADVEVSPSCKVCCRCFLVWFDPLPDRDVLPSAGADVLTLAFGAMRQLATSLKM